MELRKRWTVQMKHNIGGGGVMPPVLDPFDPSVVYVSDGWGTCYSSMRLRRLSLAAGEELDSVLTRDSVRCLVPQEERLLAVLNKRILEVDRASFQVVRTHKKGVPLYMDYAALYGTDKLLMMNWNGGFLNVFDLTAGTVRKKKAETCCGILRAGPDAFWVCTSDGLLRYAPETHQLQRVVEAGHCTGCVRGPSGKLYLLCGKTEKDSSLLVCGPAPEDGLRELVSECQAQHLSLSRDEQQIALLWNNCLTLYSIPERRVRFQHAFEEECVFEDGLGVFDESAILTYRWSKQLLTCWALEE